MSLLDFQAHARAREVTSPADLAMNYMRARVVVTALGQFSELVDRFWKVLPAKERDFFLGLNRFAGWPGPARSSCTGHCPIRGRKGLIAGNALLANSGRLHWPGQDFKMDLATAHESIRKLAKLDVRAIVCYHGGVVDDDANGQLRRVAAAVRGAQA